MFLRRIILFGFKSFAQRSVIELNRGLQIIVGPNGCGKSNIIDAIQWVCGEQSIRNLRVDKSEDIIFNGTVEQKALNVAEVEIVFDNADGHFPIDNKELSISRRLYRSGEGGYFINGQQVRLKDLRDLLGHVSLGKSLYSVLEQGSVDKLLTAKPEQRRGLFEDAAGISRYRHHSHEILHRLKRSEENIKRAEQLRQESHKRCQELAIQVKKTNKYRSHKKNMFERERDLELLRLRDLEKKSQQASETIQTISLSCEELEQAVEKVGKLHQQISDETVKFRKNSDEIRHEISQQRVAEGRIDEQLSMHRTQLVNREREQEQSQKRHDYAKQHVQQLEEELAEIRGVKNTNQIKEKELAEKQANAKIELEAIKQGIEKRKNRIKKCRQDIHGFETERSGLQKELTGLAEELAMFIDTALREYSHEKRISIEAEIDSEIDMLQRIFQSDADAEGLGNRGLLEKFSFLVEKIHEHRNAIPMFLAQLTSPGGTITRKREIDIHVEELHANRLQLQTEIENLQQENQRLEDELTEQTAIFVELQKEHVRITSELQQQSLAMNRMEQNYKNSLSRKKEAEQHLQSMIEQQEKQREKIAELESLRTDEGKKVNILLGKSKDIEKQILQNNREIDKIKTEQNKYQQLLERNRRKSEDSRIALAEMQSKMNSIHEYFREKHSQELSQYMDRIVRRSKEDLLKDIAQTKQELTVLGAVNFMAQDEHSKLTEELSFLDEQLADLYKARNDFQEIEKDVRTKSVAQFLKSFEEIRKHFKTVFQRLFGGGNCDIQLLDRDNVLDTGIEILAQPPGKKLKSMNLLSGGERSMTALALIFSIYMLRPAPFTCFDEVDAMLDSSNTALFSAMLKEFSQNSQFIVITHNDRTCTYADAMIGVTMQETGMSTVVSANFATDKN